MPHSALSSLAPTKSGRGFWVVDERRSPLHPFRLLRDLSFPEGWEDRPDIEAVGLAYYEFRAALMVRNNEGLTKTYNRFHDPDERNPEILKLRELHAGMDRAVLDVYGWTDIPLDCEFLLDYDVDEEEWGKKKKPYRYRWPDDVRDEVLVRLIELNAARAKEEIRSGATAEKTGRKQLADRRGSSGGRNPSLRSR